MKSNIFEDILEIDEYKFSLVWASLEKIDETTDWILILDMHSKELYEGHLEHETRFLKKYERMRGQ